MNDKIESNSEREEKLASDKQTELILQLYNEMDYSIDRRYSTTEVEEITSLEAQSHIEFLLETKRKQSAKSNGESKGFDKIAYSMIYKLVYRNMAEQTANSLWKDSYFKEIVLREYKKYVEALAYAREETKEGGHK